MPPRKRAATKAVDDTVKNQESPGTSTEDRSPETKEDTVPEMAPAQEVDETVKNQESLGSGNVVDRNPDPELVENPQTGAVYDVSKSSPELVDPDKDDRDARRARLRQTDAALNAKDFEDEEDEKEETPKIKLEFLESGLTAGGRVWKKGQVLELEDSEESRRPHQDTNGNVWFDLTAEEQKDRYGKVFFEKR